jgi:endonuclease/exonuclease/phosphatase family metal-dependent hydrolase
MTTNHQPSREELRRLRLAALDTTEKAKGEEMSPENSAIPSRKRPASPQPQPSLKSIPTTSTKKDSQVIDLCESSGSDDEKPAAKRVARTKTTLKKEAPGTKASANTQEAKATTNMSFQVATYNLWFGTQRDGNPYPNERMQAVADLLLAQSDPPLYFCAFQEVVHSLDDALFPLLESVGYRLVRQPLGNPMFLPYGVALAIHSSLTILDSGWEPYRMSQQDRGFCFARCRLPNNSVCLVTSTHLESWMGKQSTGKGARANQLTAMENFCNEHLDQGRADLAIMMGDLNWDDASQKPTDDRLEDVLSSVEWKDAWLTTNHLRSTVDSKKGYSYDAKLNPMLGGNLRRRFDRCLVRTARHVPTNIVSTDLFGTQAISSLFHDYQNPYSGQTRKRPTAPSDHFCLVTQLQTG